MTLGEHSMPDAVDAAVVDDEDVDDIDAGWTTVCEATDELTDALVLLIELWADRCNVGFCAGKLDVCERYDLTIDQARRLARYRSRLVQLVPWAVPTRRAGKPPGSEGQYIAFERAYPTGFISEWN